MGWMDTQAGEPSSNISSSELGKMCPEGTLSIREIKVQTSKRSRLCKYVFEKKNDRLFEYGS